jgi:hypothetical protein
MPRHAECLVSGSLENLGERRFLADTGHYLEQTKPEEALLVYRWIDVNVYRKSSGRGSPGQ